MSLAVGRLQDICSTPRHGCAEELYNNMVMSQLSHTGSLLLAGIIAFGKAISTSVQVYHGKI